jgi:hypothetical protein
LTETECDQLERWSRGAGGRLAARARAVLACAEGLSDAAAGERAGLVPAAVAKWRARFLEARLPGLAEAPSVSRRVIWR